MTEESLNEKVFRYFEGKWKVQRAFEGSCGGGFSGQASFRAKPGAPLSYDYSEQGELSDTSGKRFDARQVYRYRLVNGKIEVLKQEGTGWDIMHQLDFTMEEGVATAAHAHLCGQDNYVTGYQIDFGGAWTISYAVNGPKKDYSITTTYTPAAESFRSAFACEWLHRRSGDGNRPVAS